MPRSHRSSPRRTAAVFAALALIAPPAIAQQSEPPAGVRPAGAPEPAPTVEASALREAAIKAIERLAGSAQPSVRANAVEAASLAPTRLRPVIEGGLGDPNPGVRTVSAMVVGRLKMRPLGDRAAALANDNSEFVRAAALFADKRCGQPADITPLSTYLLDSSSPRLRSHAAFILGELGDTSAVPMLRQAAAAQISRASEAEIRLMQLQAAEALVKLGDEPQLEGIRAALYAARPDELEASVLAAQILGNLKDKGSARQLVATADYVDSRDKKSRMPAELRLAAVASLAQMGYRDGAYVADEYAADPNPAIRAQAAFAYGQIGGMGSLRRLEILLGDPDEMVQAAAAAGILRAAER